ncbi:hypothetical protein QCA50_014017 [Cerrena zonata]|uniref:Amino acid permease/ SLC12A domain-containing protein n=1 Tax=Cerrena zonata TaxID=2478898 RepID=A0AAW0FV90_9APHY
MVQNSSDEEPSGRRKNPFVKVIHSFKRSKDVDPETGDVQLNQKLDGFTLQMICVGGSIGLLINFGVLGDSRETIGFKNWRDPGMIAPNGFKFLIPALITSVFSLAGSELIGISSGESKDIKNVSKATKQVFWRILF